MISNKRGFTLVELLVVVAMLAILMGSIGSSVSGAQQRAREQKATSDVKVISQAILAYENYSKSGKFELPTMTDRAADRNSLSFLLGEGESAESGGQIPVLLQADLRGGRQLLDPWGHPYLITIRESAITPAYNNAFGSLRTGYFIPNNYRLSEGER